MEKMDIRTDEKGRPVVSEMSDRELMEELTLSFRQVTDSLESFVQTSPMARMIPGLNKFGR